MAIGPLPIRVGCPADSAVERALEKELVRSILTMNPGQLAIIRLREHYPERQVTDMLAKNADLRWVFWEPHTLAPGQTEEGYLRRRFNREAIRTCCVRTVLGFPWYPQHTHGRIPLFNPDQIARVHSFVLSGAVERNEFVQQAMHVRTADWTNWMMDALALLKMHTVVNQLDAAMRDVDRSARWLVAWVARTGLQLKFPEPLEAKRKTYATTALINRWFAQMLPFILTVPRGFRFSADEVMMTISRSAKWVAYPGQRVFVGEKDRLPHFTALPCINPRGDGPLPMLVVPSLVSAREVFAQWSPDCYITTSESGWVGGTTWMEWAQMFCEWLETYRQQQGAVDQQAILFVDSAPTRGNVGVLEFFRAHNVMVITFPPHLTHVLQPVDATWARAFKSDFVNRFRAWGRADLKEELQRALACPRGVSTTMLNRGQIVAAAVESARHASRRSNCVMGFTMTGLADASGEFAPDRPLRSPYVRASERDPEMEDRARETGRVFITSSILTSDECLDALRVRDAQKAVRVRRAHRGAAQQGLTQITADPDTDNFLVDDGEVFDRIAVIAERALGPDMGDVEGVD